VYVYRSEHYSTLTHQMQWTRSNLVGESPEELATFQQKMSWTPDDAWVRRSEDSFGMFLGIFKILPRGISLTSHSPRRCLFRFWTPPAVAGADVFADLHW